MFATLITLIVGAFVFSLVFKILFGVLGIVFKVLGTALALPFLIIAGIIFLPIIVLGLGLGLVIKLLPLILCGGIIYLIYSKVTGKEKFWYN